MNSLDYYDFLNDTEQSFGISEQEYKKKLTRILVIGDCYAGRRVEKLFKRNPDAIIDHIPTRLLRVLPTKTTQELESYDAQIIIPDPCEYIYSHHGKESIEDFEQDVQISINHVLKYYHQTKIITFIIKRPVYVNIFPEHTCKSKYTSDSISDVIHKIVKDLYNVFYVDTNEISNYIGSLYTYHGCSHRMSMFKLSVGIYLPPSFNTKEFKDLCDAKHEKMEHILFKKLNSLYRIAYQEQKIKIVFLDLDNVLWEATLSEEIDAKHLKHSIAIVRNKNAYIINIWTLVIQTLIKRGILISLISKNSFEFIKNYFSDLYTNLLFEETFTHPQINFNLKSENIKRVLELTHLTQESAIFVDDNIHEICEVKTALPNIRTLQITNDNIRSAPLFLRDLPEMQVTNFKHITKNKFIELPPIVNDKGTRDSFLKNLKLKIQAYKLTPTDVMLERVVELINKTNQFNTTGQRRTAVEVIKFIETGTILYFTLQSVYEIFGVVCVVFLKENVIEQFLLSCRAAGMDVEFNVIHFLMDKILKNHTDVIGVIKHTKLNNPIQNLYQFLSFSQKEKELWCSNNTVYQDSFYKTIVDQQFIENGIY